MDIQEEVKKIDRRFKQVNRQFEGVNKKIRYLRNYLQKVPSIRFCCGSPVRAVNAISDRRHSGLQYLGR